MTEKICPECNGEGVVDQGTEDERRCPTCNGSGVVPDDGQGSEEVWNTASRAGDDGEPAGSNQSKSARREPDLLSARR
jgi:DnaJ-class molecular chaperone